MAAAGRRWLIGLEAKVVRRVELVQHAVSRDRTRLSLTRGALITDLSSVKLAPWGE